MKRILKALPLVFVLACSGSSDPAGQAVGAAGPGGPGDADSGSGRDPGSIVASDGGTGMVPDGGDRAHPLDGGTPRDSGTAADGGPAAAPIAEQPAFTTLYAVSDLHGHYAQLTALLVKYGLVASAPAQPGLAVWAGGDATLVVLGDMIDKGPGSLEVIEAVMALQASAGASGGRVIALFGNHEAEFLGDPTGSKFVGVDRIDNELASQTPAISPVAFASGADPRGAWIRKLPFGARVGGWFFSHAGDSGGLTVAQLDAELTSALTGPQGFTSPSIVGPTSLLESRTWYTPSVVTANMAALGVKHIVFGHDPNAFGAAGVIAAPSAYAGALVKIDTGLGADVSAGAFLRVRHAGAAEVAEALLPDGTVQPL